MASFYKDNAERWVTCVLVLTFPILKHSIQEKLMLECSVCMWAVIPHAYDMPFMWALL